MTTQYHIVLASASPRRQELIRRFGLPVTIRPANVDEAAIQDEHLDPLHPQGTAETLAEVLAMAKALDVALALSAEGTADAGTVVIGSDTTVILEGELLGKPRDADDARRMLTLLRGRTHTVVTGIAAAIPGADTPIATRVVATPVTMRDYTDDEIAAYIATGDAFDKAGSYAVQHPIFQPVARIEGCVTAVIGLPLCAVADLLREQGVAFASPARPEGQICRWDARCTLDREISGRDQWPRMSRNTAWG